MVAEPGAPFCDFGALAGGNCCSLRKVRQGAGEPKQAESLHTHSTLTWKWLQAAEDGSACGHLSLSAAARTHAAHICWDWLAPLCGSCGAALGLTVS